MAPSTDDLGLRRLTPAQQLRAGRLPLRLTTLMVGLTLFGLSMAMVIRAGLGMIPWDVLHYGVARHVPLSFGTVVILVSFAVLLLWVPLREMPGLGTLANALWIGVAADVSLALLPEPTALGWQFTLMLSGVVLNGLSTAMYIGAQLGPGTRDGLMTGLARRLPVSLRLIRTGIEVAVVLVGWLLGGVVGVGTVVYAIAIGPLTQLFLPVVVIRLPEEAATPPHRPRHSAA